jgi:ferredoxin
MKLEINDSWTGLGRCNSIMPDLFDRDDSGYESHPAKLVLLEVPGDDMPR